jgi:hypothetical protein
MAGAKLEHRLARCHLALEQELTRPPVGAARGGAP